MRFFHENKEPAASHKNEKFARQKVLLTHSFALFLFVFLSKPFTHSFGLTTLNFHLKTTQLHF
jgi:hypothetical protein